MWTYYTLLPVLLLSLVKSYSTYYDFNFDDPTSLLNSSCFNSSRETGIFTYGFQATNTGPFVQALVEAHLQDNYNVILAIWKKYTSAGINSNSNSNSNSNAFYSNKLLQVLLNRRVNLPGHLIGDAGYPIAAANALIFGAKCGNALVLLFKAELSLPSVRLVGYSLGAHFMGAAAVTCKKAGFTINLLIGLDPAGPLFTGILSLGGIGPKDAAFVLIIHTNPGRFGTSDSKGTVDLWMNCGNPVQPGCAAAGGGIGIATPENLCSHDRAWKYFTEAVQNAHTFISIISSSCDDWINGNEGNLTYTLGFNVTTGSMDDYTITPLNDPVRILRDPCFNPNLRTLIYTFGYRGKCRGPATTAVLTANISTKKKNVILLDWEEEAKSGVLGIPLGYAVLAVPNAKRIGQELGEALLTLSRAGLNMSEVQLMGHSLGAHLMGHAGKWTRQRGQVLSRITGLDPARALFEGMFSIHSGLDRTCAMFVDIIHTNPGNYGTSKSTGTVDLWPNYSIDDGMQPGCPRGKFDMFTPEDLCSHDRAWRYLVEAIHSATAFPATPAENYDAWLSLQQPPSTFVYMGELTNTRARGNFYFRTNYQPPYSLGNRGMMPDTNKSPRDSATSPLSMLLKFVR